MTRAVGNLLAGLLFALAVSPPLGCVAARGPVSLAPQPGEAEGGWSAVLREHTRRAEVYDWTTRQVDLRATLVTPRLRSAFITARHRFHGRVADELSMDLLALGRPPDEGVDAPVETRPRAEEQVIVYVNFYVSQAQHRDLAASYGIWDVALVRGKARVMPLGIEQGRYSPALKAVFPHADRFDRVYVLRFPLVDPNTGQAMLSPGGPPLELHVQSAIADAQVAWSLEAKAQ